jgi:hypothetical protein
VAPAASAGIVASTAKRIVPASAVAHR